MLACTASPCYANERPQEHDDGGSLRGRGRSVAAFPAAVRRLLARNGDAFGRAVSSRCCSCQALGAAQTGPSQVRPSVDGRRGRCPRRDLGVPSTHLVGIHFILPRAGSCLAGLALALQRRHRLRRAASNAGRRGGCRACIDEAFGRTTHEWCSACAVRLDPCSGSDVLTGTPSQSRGGRKFRPVRSRFPVLHTHCPGIVPCKRSPFAPRTPCAGRTQKPPSRPASSSPRRAGARSASGGSDSRTR